MSDPYKILGVLPSDSDDKIKAAYRELAKKYHPDQYDQTPLAEVASEKMKEINEAYDQIMNDRKKGRTEGYGGSHQYGGGYNDVRSLIMNGRIADAEQILNGVPTDSRNAEWYFLKGTVLYKKGWLEEASNHFATACRMDPGNGEYQAAMNQMNGQRSGYYGGYNTSQPMRGGCSGCDVCSSLICADCCCECMGGDLIRCC